jgi:hypothetical protein
MICADRCMLGLATHPCYACRLADGGHADYAALLRRIAAGERPREGLVTSSPPPPPPPNPEFGTALRDRRLALAMADLCLYREPLSSTGCGCTARCWANRGYRGGPIVNPDECIACMTHLHPA